MRNNDNESPIGPIVLVERGAHGCLQALQGKEVRPCWDQKSPLMNKKSVWLHEGTECGGVSKSTKLMVSRKDSPLAQQAHAVLLRCHRLDHQSQVAQADCWAFCHPRFSSCKMLNICNCNALICMPEHKPTDDS